MRIYVKNGDYRLFGSFDNDDGSHDESCAEDSEYKNIRINPKARKRYGAFRRIK